MEKFALTLQSRPAIDAYLAGGTTASERGLLNELSLAIAAGDVEKVNWFAGFGDYLRQILLNVSDYRKGLEFGFTEIAFNQYGWFAMPKFLDYEEIEFEQSSIRIGRGPNVTWAYALCCRYGVAGASGPLCVYCKKYPAREACLDAALAELKADMLKYIGSKTPNKTKKKVPLRRALKKKARNKLNKKSLKQMPPPGGIFSIFNSLLRYEKIEIFPHCYDIYLARLIG